MKIFAIFFHVFVALSMFATQVEAMNKGVNVILLGPPAGVLYFICFKNIKELLGY